MKVLTHLIDKANDTLEEIEWYAEKAPALKTEHRSLADAYIKIAEMHITVFDMLHTQMVLLIDEHKRAKGEPPAEMKAIWDYEHEKLVKEFQKAKYKIEEYKKAY